MSNIAKDLSVRLVGGRTTEEGRIEVRQVAEFKQIGKILIEDIMKTLPRRHILK